MEIDVLSKVRALGAHKEVARVLFDLAYRKLKGAPSAEVLRVDAGESYIQCSRDRSGNCRGRMSLYGESYDCMDGYGAMETVLEVIRTKMRGEYNREYDKLFQMFLDKRDQDRPEEQAEADRNAPLVFRYESPEGVLELRLDVSWSCQSNEATDLYGQLRHGFLVRKFRTLGELHDMLDSYTGHDLAAKVSLDDLKAALVKKAEFMTGRRLSNACSLSFIRALEF